MPAYITSLARKLQSSSVDRGPGITTGYSELRQLTIVLEDPAGLPAVVHPSVPELDTKKNDREKGEDQKDKWAPGAAS